MRILAIFLVPLFLFAKPLPVIIDTDLDLDDDVAIIYLLSHPGVEVLGISTCRHGATTPLYSVPNAMKLTKLCNKERVPVAFGSYLPITPAGNFPESWRASANNMAGASLPVNLGFPSPLLAPEMIVDLLQKADEPVTIISLAPLTNIARALQIDPSIKKKVKAIHFTGGNLQDAASWNVRLDAGAASIVLQAQIPFHLIRDGAFKQAPITERFIQECKKIDNEKGRLVYLFAKLLKEQKGVIFDYLTALTVICPEIILKQQKLPLVIGLDPKADFGETVTSPQGVETNVIEKLDGQKAYDILLRHLQ